MPSLIDELLPSFDVRERHAITVRSTPDDAYAALRTTDLAAAWIVRFLLAARALPAALAAGRWRATAHRRAALAPVTLASFERHGFRIVAERPPSELAIGLEGRFWRLSGDLCTPPPSGFALTEPAPGTARAVWNFTIRDLGEGKLLLATETRVKCADAGARRRFLPYWYLIRPGSGLIRRIMLHEIRRTAEQLTARRTLLSA